MVALLTRMVALLTREELVCRESAKAGLRLDPDLTIDKWADQRRVLTTKAGAEPGFWRTTRVPYLKEIMQCLSPSHPSEIVVLLKGAQIGGTEVLLNWLGYVIDLAPGPFLVVQSTLDAVEKFSKQRVSPMIEATPCLRGKINPSRIKDSGNTTLVKEFPGGVAIMVGANSEDSLRQLPIRYIGLDEASMYKGYTIPKAMERSETFSRRKIFILSCPKKKGECITTSEYLQGDQRKYNVPCPDCGEYQVLVWKNIKFQHENYLLVGEVEYACCHCGSMIPEHRKPEMLERGKWVPENQQNGQFPSFHLPQFYSMLGKSKWRSAVNKFLKFRQQKKKGITTYIELLEAWTNDVLAETWEEIIGATTPWELLFHRRENLSLNPIDSRIVLICAGIDTQDDRLEVQIIGFGVNHQMWVLEYKIFYGDLTGLEIWSNLDKLLGKKYPHALGRQMPIHAIAIDTGGHYTQRCYDWVKPRASRLVFGIKGSSQYRQPIASTPSKNKGIHLFSVGVDTAKDHMFKCLGVKEPGASYVHFPLTLPEQYFRQLCMEKIIQEWVKGKKRYVYRNTSHGNNEACDTFVYAIAALNILQFLKYPNNTVPEMLEILAKQVESIKEYDQPQQRPVAAKSRMINAGVEI